MKESPYMCHGQVSIYELLEQPEPDPQPTITYSPNPRRRASSPSDGVLPGTGGYAPHTSLTALVAVIRGLHQKNTIGDYCIQCQDAWPCQTTIAVDAHAPRGFDA